MSGHWSDVYAKKYSPCADALDWMRKQPDAAGAWRDCGRGDWMLWLIGKQAGEPKCDARRPLVLAACECARLALPHVKNGETRPLRAIETAEAWARGESGITIGQVKKAAAAYAAGDAAGDAADAARKKTQKSCADIVRKHYPVAPEVRS